METGAFEEPREELPEALRAAIASDGERLVEQLRLLEQMPQVLLNLRVREKTPLEELPEVRGVIEAVEARLGNDGRVLVRYSGTEKKVRVMVEGEDPAVIEASAQEIAGALQARIGEEVE